MLQTHNLDIVLGGRSLWQSLSLTVDARERLGISAPSGFGKTTLGRVLAGWQQPSKGSVLFEGEPLPTRGYCPIQLIPQHPERTFNPVRTLGAALNDVWQPDPSWYERLNIQPHLLKRHPDEVSGGELARIALLRALDPRTRLLIADEMTAQLDPLLQAQIWQEVLHEAERRPLGMIIFSHSKALLDKVCTRVWQPDTQYSNSVG